MTSEHNKKFACPYNSTGSDNDFNYPLTSLPPPHLPPPLLPPVEVPTLIPPPLPPIFDPCVPPPIFNPALHPPLLPSFPPIPNLSLPSFAHSNQTADPEDEFKHFKQVWEERYRKMDKGKRKPTCMKVSSIKENLVQYCSLITQLESLANCMQLAQKSLSDKDWDDRCKEAEKIKAKLSDFMDNLNNPHMLEDMKRAVSLRKKKRNYKKRKQSEWQDQKREAKFYSLQEHRRIDIWLENMKDQVSRAKREEDIKREADLVLSDVTTKKTEAKRMLNLLNSLSKLRAARAHNLSTGKSITDHESNAFTEVIDRLKKMWVDQFNGYKVEEEGLKVMLGHAEEKRTSIEAAKLRKNLKAWYRGIFGSSQSSHPESLNELIQIRSDWDKFICSEDTPMASSIPVGWVLPCEPSSDEWAALLQIKA